MATIIVNVDDEVAGPLRQQARLHGVSVEQEAQRILADGTRPSHAEIAEWTRSGKTESGDAAPGWRLDAVGGATAAWSDGADATTP